MHLEYHVVDVFTTTPLQGNPLAVFPDASPLDEPMMQSIARELNLSETSFIFPRMSHQGGTRVRIFTPRAEMEFAGHPTIGTAYVMRSTGIVDANADAFTLEENIGPVNVRVDGGNDPMFWLTAPPVEALGSVARDACAAAVSLQESDLSTDIPCELLSAGNPVLFITARDRTTVDRAEIDGSALSSLLALCKRPVFVFVFAPHEGGAYSRMFAPYLGVAEDPATGSATGPLAVFMMKHGLATHGNGTRFVSEQGTKMQRRSLLHVLIHGEHGRDGIEVGGNVRPVAKGAFDVALCSQ
jgi:trans-2,3-dihydro-3-hydroxyanthranilate isomerase